MAEEKERKTVIPATPGLENLLSPVIGAVPVRDIKRPVRRVLERKSVYYFALDEEQGQVYDEALHLFYTLKRPVSALEVLNRYIKSRKVDHLYPVHIAELHYLSGFLRYQMIDDDHAKFEEIPKHLHSIRNDWQIAIEYGSPPRKLHLNKLVIVLNDRECLHDLQRAIQCDSPSIDLLLDAADMALNLGKYGLAKQYLQLVVDEKCTYLQRIYRSRVYTWLYIHLENEGMAEQTLSSTHQLVQKYVRSVDFLTQTPAAEIWQREQCLIELADIALHIPRAEYNSTTYYEYAERLRAIASSLDVCVVGNCYKWVFHNLWAFLLHLHTTYILTKDEQQRTPSVYNSLLCRVLQQLLYAGIGVDRTLLAAVIDEISTAFQHDPTFYSDLYLQLRHVIAVNMHVTLGDRGITNRFELLQQLSCLWVDVPELWLLLAEEAQRIHYSEEQTNAFFAYALRMLYLHPSISDPVQKQWVTRALIGLQRIDEARISVEVLVTQYPRMSWVYDPLGRQFELALDVPTERKMAHKALHGFLSAEAYRLVVVCLAMVEIPSALIPIIFLYLLKNDAVEDETLVQAISPAMPTLVTPKSGMDEQKASPRQVRDASMSKALSSQLAAVLNPPGGQLRCGFLKALEQRLHQLNQQGKETPEQYAISEFIDIFEQGHHLSHMIDAIRRVQQITGRKREAMGEFLVLLKGYLPQFIQAAFLQQQEGLVSALNNLLTKSRLKIPDSDRVKILHKCCQSATSMIVIHNLLQDEVICLQQLPSTDRARYQQYDAIIGNSLAVFNQLIATTLPLPAENKGWTPDSKRLC